jgi:CRP/FNR family transcriptional regulator, cyclic AMP receptor protein
MSSLTVFDHLAMHPFVADMPTTWLQRLSVHAAPILRPNGRRLFRADGVADKFWLVCAGDVALDFHVPGRGDVVIEHVRTGGVVGWSWQFAPYQWTLGGVVADELHALQFNAPGVRNLIGEDPELGRDLTLRFSRVLAERLLAARHRLIELYAYPSDPQEQVR